MGEQSLIQVQLIHLLSFVTTVKKKNATELKLWCICSIPACLNHICYPSNVTDVTGRLKA